ncbi:MAG: hypothetical protein Q7S89_00360 [bacterium]|nr:hypothetical protein [bacterium]
MKRQSAVFVVLLFSTLLMGASCNVRLAKNEGGGVWRSTDAGGTWLQRAFVHPKPNVLPSFIDTVNITRLVMAPQDPTIFFLGTTDAGLWRSLNGAWTWEKMDLPTTRIEDVTIDYSTRGVQIVYVAQGNTIMRSLDGGTTWQQVYLDPRFETRIYELALDPRKHSRLFMGTDDGRVLRSENYGADWSLIFDEGKKGITDILLSHEQAGIMYAMTGGAGVWKSYDTGTTWEKLKGVRGATIYEGAITSQGPEAVFANTNNGMLVTRDGGATWEELTLVTKSGDIRVRGFAIHPQNPLVMYYGTQQAVYESHDGGSSWEAHELPTARAATVLVLHPTEVKTVYVGLAIVKDNDTGGIKFN